MMAVERELYDLEIDLFLEAIYQRYGHDFRAYARPTLRRRLRQAMTSFGCESLSLLQHRVLREASAFGKVLAYLTVQVSDVFRDPPFWQALRTRVLPVLATYPSLKLWVAGCGTGEEVYSLAILLEEAQLLGRSTIYATDVSQSALRTAELGVYDSERAADFSRNYLSAGGNRALCDYYAAAYEKIRFELRLRENVVFSDHSLSTDQVFGEVHLITCRNVLIYFNQMLRDRALGLFHASLVRRGFLGLGAKENLRSSSHRELFGEVDRENRIYERR
jgi:chemotaxis protein methyltransferase CheR